MRTRLIRSLVVGTGLLGLAVNSAEAARCAKTTESEALQTRMLQTELMVAALSCNQRSEYNTFVTQYRPLLKKNGAALQSYFKRSYGRRGTEELNSFTTRLANESSKRSLSDIRLFCADAAKAFADLKALQSVRFATFVAGRPTADSHGMAVCSSGATVKEASLTTGKKGASTKKASSTKGKASTTKVKTKSGPAKSDASTKAVTAKADTKANGTKTKAAATKTETPAVKAAATAKTGTPSVKAAAAKGAEPAKTIKATPAKLTEAASEPAAKAKN